MPNDIEKEVAELEAKEKELQERRAKIEAEEKDLPIREEKVKALKLEEQRVIDSITEKKAQRRVEGESFGEKLRNENLDKAKKKLAKEYGYKDQEALKAVEEEFKRFDSGEVSEDKIYDNLFKAHLSINSTKYQESDQRQFEAARAAEVARARSSGSAMDGAASIPIEQVTLDDLDLEAANKIGMPIETYKRLKASGKLDN